MVNYKKDKERIKVNDLGSLYIDRSKINSYERPIIYIGGQMEHRLHRLEQSGFTFDASQNLFSGNWFYEYPINTVNKEKINAREMSFNLLKALEEANLREVDLVTTSFGGLIGAYATKSTLIRNVYAVHPPIIGTPLANPSELEKYKLYFTKQERLILKILKRIVDYRYGFEKDNYSGVDLRDVDLNKLLIIGSNLNPQNEHNKLVLALYDMIQKVTGLPSDGVVIFAEEIFAKLGLNYYLEDEEINHLSASTKDHLELVKKLITQ